MIDEVNIPNRIIEVMKQLGVTMRELSEGVGIPYRSMQKYLSGTSRMPSDVFVKICRYLDVNIQYLVDKSFDPNFLNMFDALWDVFGDGIADFQLEEKPNENNLRDGAYSEKYRLGSEAASKICEAYSVHRRAYWPVRFRINAGNSATQRFTTSLPTECASGNLNCNG